jgi:hypothetical protein
LINSKAGPSFIQNRLDKSKKSNMHKKATPFHLKVGYSPSFLITATKLVFVGLTKDWVHVVLSAGYRKTFFHHSSFFFGFLSFVKDVPLA